MLTLSVIVVASLAINWPVDACIEDTLADIQSQLDILIERSERCCGPYASCADLQLAHPYLPSGEYLLVVNGVSVTVYCEMGTTGVCGGEGGWTRIANVDIAAGDDCPSGLYPTTRDGVNLCDRLGSSGCRCDSTTFDTQGISYTKVCGRVRGYQYDGSGYIDGLYFNYGPTQDDLNSCYVDGVSITRGSPREHIWSFANAHLETGTGGLDCPCNSGSTATVPSYVGENYYCESGTSTNARYTFFSGDPLWDGQDCNNNEADCCTNLNLPYFVRDLPTSSTDGVELRMCTSEGLPDEAVGIDQIELYIK